jgi:hypothetical protein
MAALKQRLTALRTRMDQLYEDKLDGNITEEFWKDKLAGYADQERTIETALSSLSAPITSDRVLTVQRIFELANKAHFLYVTRNSGGRGPIAEIGTFKLRDGWRKSLAHLQKAVRPDLPEGQK